ncbi:protein kinase domain-containing protein [Gemmata sp.]|uniref:protein kinase domain-containing protein n=1 Tax=Gemmata sp. TaxID=1914242 RepID=UPI003F6EDA1A
MSSLLNDLLDRLIVLPEEWEELDAGVRAEVATAPTQPAALDRLVALHLLTPFQADTLRDGSIASLTLGQYRVLGLLGRGGMGVVYRAEHVHLRRDVAVKVFVNSADTCPRLLRRFHAEARAAARLHHPNLVACLDAGRTRPDPGGTVRDYYVMELVNGQDLDGFVRSRGPLPVNRACDLFRQVSEGLAEAHRHGLIHRDIKPPNIVVTPDWRAKLLDFGLALHPYRQLTEPGTVLGTIGYMAPEQARDPHAVDARADLFSLGASMYWALTGRDPFPETGHLLRDLQTRLTAPPPNVQQVRPELPEELCTLVNRMLSTDPDARPPSARVVGISLAGLSRWVPQATERPPSATAAPARPSVVIVEDDAALRKLLRLYLGDEYAVAEASDGEALREILQRQHADLVILDVNLPGVTGDKLIDSIRTTDTDRRPLILLMSGVIPPEALGGLMEAGADDFLAKPFSRAEFRSRVRGLLGRRAGSEPAQAAALTMRVGMADLTRTPAPPGLPPQNGAHSAVQALTGLCAQMFREILSLGPAHSERMGRYVRALAGAVPDRGEYSRLKDERFVGLLETVAPLHDLGMVAVPYNILNKPAALDDHERMVVQTHPVMGAEWVTATAEKCPSDLSALALAAEVIRSHHERWDGAGYPDGLAGDAAPLAARVVGLVSVYDALRSRRPYRPALSHARVVRMMTTESAGQFDPTLLAALASAAARFEKIYQS